VNSASGTINLKALFDNKHIELFPTQLLRIEMLVKTLHDVLLVPSEAVQTGPDSDFVYVIKSDNTVDVRKVKIGSNEDVDGQDLTEIQDGLSPGEVVVTNGVDKLEAGSKVEVIHRESATTRRSASTRPTTRPEHGHRTLTGGVPEKSSGGESGQ
jgi:multidrug efflux system membrane fusion protein